MPDEIVAPGRSVADDVDGVTENGVWRWKHDGLHHVAPGQVNEEVLKSGKTLCYQFLYCLPRLKIQLQLNVKHNLKREGTKTNIITG